MTSPNVGLSGSGSCRAHERTWSSNCLISTAPMWTCPERADTSQVGVSPRGGSPYGEAGGGERGTPAEATVVHAGVQGRGHRLGTPGRSVVAGDLPRARPE